MAIRPYGTWDSPITADLVATAGLRLGQVEVDGDAIYWTEMRPTDGGRTALVRWTPAGGVADVTPPGFDVRSRVHEYGGGAFTVQAGTVCFVNGPDQRVWVQRPGAAPEALTAADCRFADLHVTPAGLVAVGEQARPGREPENFLALISLADGRWRRVMAGNDFYASPALAPDGRHLAWLTWNHPNMPWDGTELWVGELSADGVREARPVAGGPAESVFQPAWAADGALHFVSDRGGWWNLYWLDGERAVCCCPLAAEFGDPQWVFRQSAWAFAGDRVLCRHTAGGASRLALLDRAGQLEDVGLDYVGYGGVRTGDGFAAFVATSANRPAELVRLDLRSRVVTILRRTSTVAVPVSHVSVAKPVSFPSAAGRQAHGYYYAPVNPDFAAPAGELPPLIVTCHGGPTAATSGAFHFETQYWTSRGFALLDVNYGGSTGYGRAFRELLKGQWGVVDVEDCIAAARHAVARGWVDGRRRLITGGSAGGFTVLAVLTRTTEFAAGASYYGVSDLEALARDTHKFEAHYLDGLVGPYPAAQAVYRERSPISRAEHLASPVIFFQGLEDRIVPPSQAEMMVAALRQKGVPVEYVTFAGEQHGFRQAANIADALQRELAFYRRVLKLG